MIVVTIPPGTISPVVAAKPPVSPYLSGFEAGGAFSERT